MRRVELVLTLLVAVALMSGVALARPVVSLDGMWEAIPGELAAPPADSAAWAPVAVPHTSLWRPEGPHAIWYRRRLDVPTAWAGRHVVVRVGGAKYSHKLYIDGKLVGSHTGGFEPVEYDVTAQVVCGKKSDLLIGVGDWTSLLAEGAKVGDPVAGQPVGSWVKDGLAAPLGAMGGEVGLTGSVTLEARPRVWVEEVRVEPQDQPRTLRVVVMARNDGTSPEPVNITARLLEGGQGPRLAPAAVTLAPGKTASVTLQAEWPQARLWTPHDPHLYTLIAALTTGALVDSQQVTFGFRDFRAQGDSFLLNGVPVRLLAMDDTRTRPSGRAPEAVLAAARAAGATAVRLAGEPWPDEWYDAADQAGMLVIADTALWELAPSCAPGREAFWTNARDHVSATVKRLHNHPSVVIWNVASGLLSSGSAADQGVERKVAELTDLVRQLDPTRPVMCSGDASPLGKVDVISVRRLPQAGFRFGAFTARDDRGATWQWDRGKPLHLGALVRIPPTDVRSATGLLGDAAYPDAQNARLAAEEALRNWQIIAAREAGVSLISGYSIDPATGAPLLSEPPPSYYPVAAFDLSPNAEVFAGSVVPRRLSVMNDSLSARDLELRWRLAAPDGEWEVAGSAPVSLPPAGRQTIDAAIAIPEIEVDAVPATFDLDLWEDGRLIFATSAKWNVRGRALLSGPVVGAPARIAAYDPDGETLGVLAQVGVKPTLLTQENASRTARWADLMIVGKGALRDPLCPTGSAIGRAMLDCARRGGAVLVFEQTEYPRWLLPLALTDREAAVAFPRYRSHFALRGLGERDLAQWPPDGLVSRHEIRKPDRVGFLSIVDSGGPAGLETAGLAELRLGDGRFLLCQLDVTSKYGLDPAATRLVRNLLAPAAGELRPRHAAALVDDAVAAELDAVGLQYDRISTPLHRAPLDRYQVLIISDLAQAQPAARRLQQFVKGGGQVVLHSVTADTADAVARLVGHPLLARENSSGAVRLAARSGPAAALSNEELAWFFPGGQAGVPVLSPAVADYTVSVPPSESAVLHAEPGVLLSFPLGRGRWVIDQVRWDRPEGHEAQARRYLSTLLTTLGCQSPALR